MTPETIKLLESTKNKMAKEKNGENIPHIEIKEEVLVHCIIVNKDYQPDYRVFYTFLSKKTFLNLLINLLHQKIS